MSTICQLLFTICPLLFMIGSQFVTICPLSVCYFELICWKSHPMIRYVRFTRMGTMPGGEGYTPPGQAGNILDPIFPSSLSENTQLRRAGLETWDLPCQEACEAVGQDPTRRPWAKIGEACGVVPSPPCGGGDSDRLPRRWCHWGRRR